MLRRPSTTGFWDTDFQSEHFQSSCAASSGAVIILEAADIRPHRGVGRPFPDGPPALAARPSAKPIDEAHEASAYLMLRPRSLRQTCHDSRRDDDGLRCPACDLRDLCERQANGVASAPA
jgi:hypothetical protein